MQLLHLLDLLEAKPSAGFYHKEIDTSSCLQQAGELWLASASDKPAENGSIRPRHWFLLVEAASLPACHGGWGEQGSQDNPTDWRQFITPGCWPHGWWGKPLSFLLHRTFNNLCVTPMLGTTGVWECVYVCVPVFRGRDPIAVCQALSRWRQCLGESPWLLGEIWIKPCRWVDEDGRRVLCVLAGVGGGGGWLGGVTT